MKPDRTGIWEWFELDGTRRLVYVWNVFEKHPNLEPYFRVCCHGSYYNVHDIPEDGIHGKAEWIHGTWGNYMGQYEDFDESQLYLMFDFK